MAPVPLALTSDQPSLSASVPPASQSPQMLSVSLPEDPRGQNPEASWRPKGW